MPDDEKAAGGNWAVAVVHGVGESKPVEMLQLVTSALATQRRDIRFEKLVSVHLPDAELDRVQHEVASRPRSNTQADEAGGKCPPPPVDPLTTEAVRPHSRAGWIDETKNASVRVATAQWSDISMFGDGILRLIGNLALGGMGVRYFADVGTSGNNIVAKALHGLLALKIWLLALGFLPIVLCTLVFSLHTFIGYYIFRNETFLLQAWAISIFSALTIWSLAFTARKMLWHMRNERSLAMPIFLWLRVYGYGMAALILLDHPRAVVKLLTGKEQGLGIAEVLRNVMLWYGETSGNNNWMDRVKLLDETGIYIGFLQFLQYICGYGVICLTALVLITLAIARIRWICSEEQLRGMVLAAVGVTTIWLLMLFVLWPENLITATVINRYLRNVSEPVLAPVWSFGLQLAWPPINIEATTVRSVDQLREFMPLLWFDVFFLVFLIATTAIAVFIVKQRSKWSKSHERAGPAALDAFPIDMSQKSLWAPRLILAGSYQTAVLVFMVVIAGTATAHTLKLDKWIASKIALLAWMHELPHELFMSLANVTLIVVASIVLFLFGAHKIQKAIKLALDVVNHFASPGKAFPIRTRIRQRLIDTLEFLLKPADKPHLVVVCHSQGTVIALDTLLGHRKFEYAGRWPLRKRKVVVEDGLWEKRLKSEVASLTILSFGSPITHIYQHYFSTLYPALEKLADGSDLGKDIETGRISWINCFRIDDYIGTHIDPIRNQGIRPFPLNIPMGIGGHTDYWKEDVFKRLFSRPELGETLVAPTPP